MSSTTRYGDIVVFDGEPARFEERDHGGAHVVRLIGATDPLVSVDLQKSGFLWADRTLQTTIVLAKCPADTAKLIRMPIVETSEFKDEIYRIAVSSFTYDRRFHVYERPDSAVSGEVLRVWVDNVDKALVALNKDAPIGFLVLNEVDESTGFVHLAAVYEKYRTSGAAMALYAKAIEVGKARGYKKILGRISSQNTAVMNLYSYFGAVFSDPQDIFLKEVR